MSGRIVAELWSHKIDAASIHREDYEIVGAGAQGTIYKATYNGKPVAVKELKCILDEERLKLMLKLKHENLIEILGFCDRPYSLVMPLCVGTLRGIITNSTDINSVDFYRYTTQIASGMQYLHNNNVVHRDLKPENILLTTDLNVKIGDFDLSKENEFTLMSMTTVCGTSLWMAPEIYQGTYSQAIDVWSYAVVVWEMITQRIPYGYRETINESQFRDALCNKLVFHIDCMQTKRFNLIMPHGNNTLPKTISDMLIAYKRSTSKIRLPYPAGITYFLRQLLNSCFSLDPNDRPSFKHVVSVLQCVKIQEQIWDTMKPQWRRMKYDYSFSKQASHKISKSQIIWQNFVAEIKFSLRRYLRLVECITPDLKSVERLLRESFSAEQKTIVKYVMDHEVIYIKPSQPSIAEFYQRYNCGIDKLRLLKKELLESKIISDDFPDLVLFNLRSKDASVREEGFRRLSCLVHEDRYEGVQNEALPFIMRTMGSRKVELVRACSEILAVERMTKKLKINEPNGNFEILISAFQRHVLDKSIACCLLSIFSTVGKLRSTELIKPIMTLLRTYRSSSARTVEDQWIARSCWELLQTLTRRKQCCEAFFFQDGLGCIYEFVEQHPGDCFLQKAIFSVTWNCAAAVPSQLIKNQFLSLLCDYIENTSFHAFFSFDAVSTLSRLLNTDGTGTIRRKPSAVDLSAYTRRAMAAVRSWEFGEINVVFSNKREEIEKTIEQNILSQLLYAIISADVAMTSATKSRIMIANEGNEILEQLLIKSTDQTNETVKLFAQIASEKWQVLKSGQISSL